MTYGEIVSRIQNQLNTLNKDMFIPRRLILSVFKSKAEFLISQKFHDKSLFRETNIFKWLECIKLEEVDSVQCGKLELPTVSNAMVSVKKLPKLIWSRYGASVLMVTNLTRDKEYSLITPFEYNQIRNSKHFSKFKGKYAIIYPDGRIAIPDATVKKINMLVFTLDENAEDICECEDKINCNSYWDFEFEIPDKIQEAIIQETLKEISLRVQIPEDEHPGGDSNQKTKNQQ